MEETSLFEQSIEAKSEADAFLQETELLSFLQPYGHIEFAGSYSLNLMMNRDIDLYVINSAHTQNSTLAILNASIQSNRFRLHLYYDSFQFPGPGMPPGYYIGIKTPFRAHKWKVDIWCLHADLPARTQLIQAVHQLDDAHKLAILRFKRLAIEKNLDISSIVIYEAVLQKHLTDESDFLAFLAQRQ